jgi:hypothetical protein
MAIVIRRLQRKALYSDSSFGYPRIEWRRGAPPLDSLVLFPKQNLLCYSYGQNRNICKFIKGLNLCQPQPKNID